MIEPHGGTLVDLLAAPERVEELKENAREYPSWDLTSRQICDLELLLNGGFSPLTGFMGRRDFESVAASMRLADGTLWPIPISLDVTEEMAAQLDGEPLVLRDPEGVPLAVLHVDDVWEIDREAKARAVYGTLDEAHPGVAHLMHRTNNMGVGGRLEGLQLPAHYDFPTLRLTPAELRERFARRGWRRVVAFQTRNPMHRAHFELTLRAARELEANLLIHPAVGVTKPGDVDHYTRVRCYQALLPHYPQHTVELALLPLAMRMGGPREALWHGIIRKNYGCSHFIIGRDHAGPGNGSDGKPFYGPYEAQELFREHQDELGMEMVPFRLMVYLEDQDSLRAGGRGGGGHPHAQHLRHRAARAAGHRPRHPRVVHLSGGRQRAAPHPPAAPPPGLHRLLHRPLRRRQVDRRQRAAGQAPGDGRPAGDPARRRHRAQEPVLRARLLQGAPRPQHPPHRLRGLGDHQERRHRPVRPDRPLRPHPPRGARRRGARRRLRAGPRRDLARGVRAARPQGPLRQGAGRDHQGVHRHLRPLRGAHRRRPGARQRHS